jgi:hypothetical protein
MTAADNTVNDEDVSAFLDSVHNKSKAEDARKLLAWMTEATGCPARMWGANVVGFGTYERTDADGKKADWMRIGFSLRKRELVAYIMPGFDAFDDLLSRLGKHKTGESLLYIKRLSDVDEEVLEQLIRASVEQMAASVPSEPPPG